MGMRRGVAVLLAGVLAFALSGCFPGFLPDDNDSAQRVEAALTSSDLGVVEARVSSTVSGFGRDLSVWVELDDASLPAERVLDILGVIVQNMNTSAHSSVGVSFRSGDSNLRPPVEELNELWHTSNSNELFNTGSVDTTAPKLYTETKKLKRFLEEQGR